MSVWLLASKDLAKALNKESLYMIPLHGKFPPRCCYESSYGSIERCVSIFDTDSLNMGILSAIGHPQANIPQRKAQAATAVSTSTSHNSSAETRSVLEFVAYCRRFATSAVHRGCGSNAIFCAHKPL
jgi:hypothetical protein